MSDFLIFLEFNENIEIFAEKIFFPFTSRTKNSDYFRLNTIEACVVISTPDNVVHITITQGTEIY